jgi:hypothetical protein
LDDHYLECPHCHEHIFVLAHPKAPTTNEREDADGTRTFVIVAGDGWLLHRCVIARDN